MKHPTAWLVGAFLLTLAQPAFSRSGDKAGNGGDPNEIKFKSVAANIAQWIDAGNGESLQFPAGVSAGDYRREMLAALANYDIEFTNEVVRVRGAEKTCRNLRGSGGRGKILCHSPSFGRFYAANIDDIYRIVHHEFAGLAGIEENSGQESDYRISAQIAGYLRTEFVKRLPVRPSGENDPFWLPASGWRQEMVLERDRQSPVPFVLDYRNQDWRDDGRRDGGYLSQARLFERDIFLSVEDASAGSRAEVRTESGAAISRKDRGRNYEAAVDRLPQRSAQPGMTYDCTLIETGETVAVLRGSGPVPLPSQEGVRDGRIVITATANAFFISENRADGTDTVVRITRGALWASVKFTGGKRAARSLACVVINGR